MRVPSTLKELGSAYMREQQLKYFIISILVGLLISVLLTQSVSGMLKREIPSDNYRIVTTVLLVIGITYLICGAVDSLELL